MRSGWPCSQNTRICGSARMIEIGGGEAALQVGALGAGEVRLVARFAGHHPEQDEA